MVIDTSAVAAILFREDDWQVYAAVTDRVSPRLISAVSRVEMSCVIESRKRDPGRVLLERFLAMISAEVVDVSVHQATLAIEAFRRFGKGRHPAALNIGDCFAYALASATAQPLLFKGGDFGLTDIASVLA